jgi:hypothetical protein
MTSATAVDRARQALNVLFAVDQIAATFAPPLTGCGRPLGEDEPGMTANPAALQSLLSEVKTA